jgi:hypothetical protein
MLLVLIRAKPSVGKSVVYGLAVLKCHNAEIFPEFRYEDPKS